jgi:hypothetical protein
MSKWRQLTLTLAITCPQRATGIGTTPGRRELEVAGQVNGRVGLAAQDKRERTKLSRKRGLRENTEKNLETIHRIAEPSNLKARQAFTLRRVDKRLHELV